MAAAAETAIPPYVLNHFIAGKSFTPGSGDRIARGQSIPHEEILREFGLARKSVTGAGDLDYRASPELVT
jgi:hypothetical protein